VLGKISYSKIAGKMVIYSIIAFVAGIIFGIFLCSNSYSKQVDSLIERMKEDEKEFQSNRG